jgi:hypothetical protein
MKPRFSVCRLVLQTDGRLSEGPGNISVLRILVCVYQTERRHITNDCIGDDQFAKIGERGSVVVKALCYKPESRGFETRLGE